MNRTQRSLCLWLALPTLAIAGDPVSLEPLTAPVAPREILETWTSAPRDSLVLRISLGYGSTDEIHAPYLVVEEMVAPRPLRFWMDGDPPPPDPHPDDFARVLRIDGRALINAAAGRGPTVEGGPKRAQPGALRFDGWIAAHDFVLAVSDVIGETPLLIARHANGRYAARSIDGQLQFDLPTEPLPAPLMSAAIVRVTTGPASQSLTVRVALETHPGRCCSSYGIVVEEFGWPPPGVVMLRGSGHDPAKTEYYQDHDRWLRGGRVDHDALREIWNTTPRQHRLLNGHLMLPIEFKAWLAPNTFAAGSGELCLVIRRTGEGQYAIVEAMGDVME